MVKQKQEFIEIYNELKGKYGWRVDKGVLLLTAAQYAGGQKAFDLKSYIEVVDYINDRAGAFSFLKSNLGYSLAGLLITNCENPAYASERVQECYDLLIDRGFKRSPYSYISAYSLYMAMNEGEDMKAHCDRAMEVYKGMRKQHFFFTSHDDYPLAVLLAESGDDPVRLLEDMSYFYQQMDGVMGKGNDRQFLSHILTYGQHDQRDVLVQNTKDWIENLKQQNVKLKGLHYPAVGVLGLADQPENLLYRVLETYNSLIKEKSLRWHKDLCFLLAVRFVVQEKLSGNQMLNVGLATTIESILQAQQSAMISAMTAATATANANSGS
ncbi:DUF4003 family protein [Jeotgalibacillus soli]|uniref:DUF4003 domain-containing protein n=1 Tax=Jeotgalibacillus soli TaxID=889306 RepID=A0A0C2RP69_9BACL|nr:DUF4003 family protein [Jeotgalibacillus soli]KIL52030.1 hypothetical protein KP78_04000 [Jeotgalibacillus soli]